MQDTAGKIPFSADSSTSFSPSFGKPISQLTCVIPGGGCVYYRAQKGDVCPFCAFPQFARHVVRGPGHDEDFAAWTLDASTYQEMYQRSINEFPHADRIALFNGGSFFPEAELPAVFQNHVYQDVASRPEVHQLMVEAYPTFITRRKLEQAVEMLNGKELMIGIGFESQNDFVRNTLLKKRIDRDLFENKIQMMHDRNVKSLVYAFLKAPGLTEREALDDALKTCEYLTHLGVDEIALSCAFVPPGSSIEALYKQGKFRPPWLWSILEIKEQAEKKGWPVTIGGFEDFPPPVAAPANCEKCTPKFLDDIENIRLTGKAQVKNEACACKQDWQKLVS